jgi:hypothetical protein
MFSPEVKTLRILQALDQLGRSHVDRANVVAQVGDPQNPIVANDAQGFVQGRYQATG